MTTVPFLFPMKHVKQRKSCRLDIKPRYFVKDIMTQPLTLMGTGVVRFMDHPLFFWIHDGRADLEHRFFTLLLLMYKYPPDCT
jgi:hypothetical protein